MLIRAYQKLNIRELMFQVHNIRAWAFMKSTFYIQHVQICIPITQYTNMSALHTKYMRKKALNTKYT